MVCGGNSDLCMSLTWRQILYNYPNQLKRRVWENSLLPKSNSFFSCRHLCKMPRIHYSTLRTRIRTFPLHSILWGNSVISEIREINLRVPELGCVLRHTALKITNTSRFAINFLWLTRGMLHKFGVVSPMRLMAAVQAFRSNSRGRFVSYRHLNQRVLWNVHPCRLSFLSLRLTTLLLKHLALLRQGLSIGRRHVNLWGEFLHLTFCRFLVVIPIRSVSLLGKVNSDEISHRQLRTPEMPQNL